MRSQRYDIYALIHKGLRAFMTHALVRVGRLDVDDAAELAEVSEEVAALIEICRRHLKHENIVIHTAMEARAPGSTSHIAADHVEHLAALDRLAQRLPTLAGDRIAAHALYHGLAAFVAENFEHMQHEETEHNAVLWAHYDDDEIRALEHHIVSILSPDEVTMSMRWMLPHMTPAERAGMLAGMRANAPVEVFEGVLSLVRPLLGGRDWRKLAVALGL